MPKHLQKGLPMSHRCLHPIRHPTAEVANLWNLMPDDLSGADKTIEMKYAISAMHLNYPETKPPPSCCPALPLVWGKLSSMTPVPVAKKVRECCFVGLKSWRTEYFNGGMEH